MNKKKVLGSFLLTILIALSFLMVIDSVNAAYNVTTIAAPANNSVIGNVTSGGTTYSINVTAYGDNEGTNVTNVTLWYKCAEETLETNTTSWTWLNESSAAIGANRSDWKYNWSTTLDLTGCSVNVTANGNSLALAKNRGTVNSNITVDSTAPYVTLSAPANDTWYTNQSVTFRTTVTDVSLVVCNLSGNWTTGWHVNQTSSSLITNATAYSFTAITLSDATSYLWNVKCFDKLDRSSWALVGGLVSNFSVRIGSTSPTAVLTEPSSTTVETTSSIKYTCDGGTTSALNLTCKLEVTKSNGDVYEKTGCGTEQTLESSDIDRAGTYTIKCITTNSLNLSATTASSSFDVIYSTQGGGTSGGGGGGGGASTSADLSITGTATTTTQQGRILTVSLDGTTNYDVTIKSVTSSTATVTIASKDTTMALGESREVDLDGDGTNDAKATLDSITNGQAKITFGKLTVEAAQEEVIPEEVTAAKKSLWWLWTVIAIVIVAAAIILMVKKK